MQAALFTHDSSGSARHARLSVVECRVMENKIWQNLIKQVLWSSGYDSRLGYSNIGCERSPVRVRARPYLFGHLEYMYISFSVLLVLAGRRVRCK